MVAVFAIAFLDESVQGLLASRYYAIRDVSINLLAGFLPLLGLFWLPLRPREKQERIEAIPSASKPSTGDPGMRFQASDRGPVLLALLLVFGVSWVGKVSWNLDPLYGYWERENRCGRVERIQVGRDGTVLWEDVAGGRARGRYRIGGNSLMVPCSRWRSWKGRVRVPVPGRRQSGGIVTMKSIRKGCYSRRNGNGLSGESTP